MGMSAVFLFRRSMLVFVAVLNDFGMMTTDTSAPSRQSGLPILAGRTTVVMMGTTPQHHVHGKDENCQVVEHVAETSALNRHAGRPVLTEAAFPGKRKFNISQVCIEGKIGFDLPPEDLPGFSPE